MSQLNQKKKSSKIIYDKDQKPTYSVIKVTDANQCYTVLQCIKTSQLNQLKKSSKIINDKEQKPTY